MLRDQTEERYQRARSTGNKAKSEIASLPEILAIVRAVEHDLHKADGGLWRIGDVLIPECGKPGARGVTTGALEKLKRIANALRREGFGKKYSICLPAKTSEDRCRLPG